MVFRGDVSEVLCLGLGSWGFLLLPLAECAARGTLPGVEKSSGRGRGTRGGGKSDGPSHGREWSSSQRDSGVLAFRREQRRGERPQRSHHGGDALKGRDRVPPRPISKKSGNDVEVVPARAKQKRPEETPAFPFFRDAPRGKKVFRPILRPVFFKDFHLQNFV